MINTTTRLTLLLIFICIYGNAQSLQEIKENRAIYIWGEGSGSTLKKADQQALSMLINQISITVESKFEHFKTEDQVNGEFDLHEKVNSVVKTYSNATLHNTERLVINNEPDARVLRYIKRADVAKVFEDRKNKVLSFIDHAQKAKKEFRIADALRYYYWGQILLKSHPDCNAIEHMDDMGKTNLLISWIPAQLNEVFSNMHFSVKENRMQDNVKTLILQINYKNNPVTNFDYSYWDGRDWTNIISAKDGEGYLEYYGVNANDKNSGKIKAEYMYESQAQIDDELENVLEQIEPLPYRQSYYNLNFSTPGKTPNKAPSPKKHDISVSDVQDSQPYIEKATKVITAIAEKKTDKVQHLFTLNGFEMFTKLVGYGKATLVNQSELKVYRFNGEIMCRSVRLAFHFNNNFRNFVEDLVFHFNDEQKIDGLSFGLSKIALQSILENNAWTPANRLILINFLENYKTAYALERLDYLESIFADDALIITGRFVKVRSGVENKYQDNMIVKLNRQSKQQYIRNLRMSFRSKEFINIQFEESKVRKGGAGGNIYGVQIKQNYYSSNYGDKGYLFLLVDLNEPQKPTIHVRTWQPDKSDNDLKYGLSDF
jgi:hypothetical protein